METASVILIITGCIFMLAGLGVILNGMRHKHVWTVIEQKEQPSPLENLKSAGLSSMRGGGLEDSWTRLGKRDVIVKRRCEECGTEEVVRV